MTVSTSGWSRPSHVRTISGSDKPASSSKYSCADRGRPCSAKRWTKMSHSTGSSSDRVPLKSKMIARGVMRPAAYCSPMPLTALLLALAAACVHALWNVLLARARDIEAATAVALLVSIVAFAPVTAAVWDVRAAVWPFVLGSGALQFTYFTLLAAAYRRAPLSVVYPIARGAAPVLVLLIGVAALGKGTSWGQAAGVCLVGAGVFLVRGLERSASALG